MAALKAKPTRIGKIKTNILENRPSVGFRFIKNRSVLVSVSVSRRALVGAHIFQPGRKKRLEIRAILCSLGVEKAQKLLKRALWVRFELF
jgi:hypothetical protein